ncbi:MAG: vitamin K epoxide reductase family protein [Armatimonadota bacterium]|nr:vitamin K epoxide reductase family protein [Armatimonadota bacterium]MDR7601960.1 vitamin K epoxide reductase family protein [Armatimonadota bacterium]
MGTSTDKYRGRVPGLAFVLLALGGFALSTYLWLGTGGTELRLCPAGSGCQVVQSSRYASLWGIPLPVYGMAYYGTLLGLWTGTFGPERRWVLSLPLTGAGAGASLVFLGVQRFVLGTFCALCVLSAGISFALLALAWTQGDPSRRWLGVGVPLVLSMAFVTGGYAVTGRRLAADAYAEGLAKHLARAGAVFYGAYWCPHCAEQKRLFGQAARHLPYVECDPRSPEGNPRACEAAGVRAYPTWIIQGRRYEGVLTLEELARLSGYPPP